MDKEKPLAVAVLTPSTGICRMEYTQSLVRLVAYFWQVPVFKDTTSQLITTATVLGSGIAQNYESLVEQFLNDKDHYWTHFLSIEDDMGFAPECLHMLLSHKLPIVGANYSVNKGRPLRFTATKGNGRVITKAESTGLEEAENLPQGFTLVEREVYEKIPKPWFLTVYNPASGSYVIQDYYFSTIAREAGYKLYVDHDVSKRIFHVGPKAYTWEDALADEIKQTEEKN